MRQITNRNHSKSFDKRLTELSTYLSGSRGYYGYCETPSVLKDLDRWIRRRLRNVLWKQWKVFKRRKAELRKRGVSQDLAHATAWSSKGLWNVCRTPGVRRALP